MSLRNFITESIILPFSDLIVGQNIKEQLAFLQESQWWPKEQLIEYQNEKLRKLIFHSYNNVPYYKEIMNEKGLKPNDIQTVNDLEKLPILTKDDFKANYPEKLRAKNWRDYKIVSRSSSGSTGKPIQYLMTREGYSFNNACNLRGWYWMGFRLGDKLIKISQNERKTIEKKLQDKANNTLLFSTEYSRESLEVFIDVFNKFKPKYLRSYPDPLHFIAMILQENDIQLKGLKAINTTGNILFPELRALVEDRFEVKIFDSYSCEGGANFFECPTHTCYHGSMEYGITEILDHGGNEVKIGEAGFATFTDLHNFVMPFIRYDSKDVVTKAEKCSCGRSHVAIKDIKGRENDIVITPSGQFLIAQTFTTYFKYFNTIDYFQIYQTSKDEMIIKLKVTSEFNEEEKSKIIEYWKSYTKNQMKIYLEIIDSIDLLTSGKRRFIIRDESISLKM